MAWHIAALGRVKRFPKLKEMLVRDRRKRPQQSAEQQKAAAMAWTMLYGGTVRTIDGRR